MTASAGHHVDPLARLGRQLVEAAEQRMQRRRRQRTVLTVSATTVALGGAVGVAAIETDVIGPTPPASPYFAQHGGDRVDLSVSEGLDKPWRVVVYRSLNAGLCITVPTSSGRATQGGCGAASVTAEELDHAPVTSTVGTVVQSGADGEDDVIVSGLARTDVESLRFESTRGTSPAIVLDGKALSAPIVDGTGHETNDVLTVRPFAVLAIAPAGASSLTLIAHTRDGEELPYPVRIEQSQGTP